MRVHGFYEGPFTPGVKWWSTDGHRSWHSCLQKAFTVPTKITVEVPGLLQKNSGSALDFFFESLQSCWWEVISRCSPVKAEIRQLVQHGMMPGLHHPSGFREKVIIGDRQSSFDVFFKGFRIFPNIRTAHVEQRIAVVKQGRWFGNRVGTIVHQHAKVSKMPVCVADDGIENDHVFQRIHERRAQFLILGGYSLHPAACYQLTNRKVGIFFAGE